ncbi:zinc ribbon domain-containing protein [bacterium]|nr:zinc ribbon domain-containing protein [bacterium]
MFCVKCGFANKDEDRICQKCGATLPRFISETKEEPKEVVNINERLQLFEDAVSKLKGGQLTIDGFAEFLDKISAVLAEKEAGIRSIEIPEEAIDDFKEELDTGFEGIALYNSGIASMYAYIEDLDETLLDEGLDKVRLGNERINEAMRINRENREKLEGNERNML